MLNNIKPTILNILRAFVVRVFVILHGFAFYWTSFGSNEIIIAFISTGIILVVLEFIYCCYKRKGKEWKWFVY
jgi:hypothetical protein